jgi:hypothetical protein
MWDSPYRRKLPSYSKNAQTWTTTLNGDLRDTFYDWYPTMAQTVENLPIAG